MDDDNISEMSIGSTVADIFCPNCRKHFQKHRFSFTIIFKAFIFCGIVALFMIAPMGDPTYECRRKKLTQCCNVTAWCNAYYGFRKMVYVAATTSEVVMCYILESLYKAKLSAYDILAKIDQKDLCQFACGKNNIIQSCINAKVQNSKKSYKVSIRQNEFKWDKTE